MNPRASIRRYAGIAARLRERIRSGACPPGTRLPTERDLALEFGVTRVTIRRALRLLEEERLLRRLQGSGTYVSPQPSRRIPLMIDYTRSMRDHAPRLKRALLTRAWKPAGPDEASALELEPDARILFAERIDTLEGEPVAWDRAFIPEPFAHALDARKLERVDFLETWSRAAHFRIGACRQTIEAVAADAANARHLRLKPGRPLLRSTEVYLSDNRRPAGLFISQYHPDRMCIASRFDWNTPAQQGKARAVRNSIQQGALP